MGASHVSEQPIVPVPDPKGLQFERAEPQPGGATALSCSLCRRPISDSYYEANGKIVCPD
jgi:hypothetical protein